MSRYQVEISSSNRTNDAGAVVMMIVVDMSLMPLLKRGETDAFEIDAVWRVNLLSNVER